MRPRRRKTVVKWFGLILGICLVAACSKSDSGSGGAPPKELVAAAWQVGGTENITVISTASSKTVDTLVRGRVISSLGGLAQSSDGDVYFGDYNSGGVSYVSTNGTVKLVGPDGVIPALSSDDRYLSFYNGPFYSGSTGAGSSPVIEIIDRASGQRRTFDLSTDLGPGYIVRSLAWLASTDTLAVQAEILPTTSFGGCNKPGASTTTQPCPPAPLPVRPRLVLLDATALSGSAHVFDIGQGWTLVGPGPKTDTVDVEVQEGDTAQLLTAGFQRDSLQQILLARLPAGTTVQSVDPGGRYVLYLKTYLVGPDAGANDELDYATISHEQITAIHRIPGRFVAATWAP